MKVKNYLEISPKLSSSGQPASKDFELIAEHGYQVVINLSMPDSKSALTNEGYLVTLTGMTYIHIPVAFDAPELSHLIAFFDAMEAFLYLYSRLLKRKSKEDSEKYIYPHWEPNDTWSGFIERCEAELL